MNAQHTSDIPLARLRRGASVLLIMVIALAVALPATAESAAELLEQGIYTEQTVGDLKAAIEIYTRVVENAEANRPHVAQAQFRLGMCYLKNGSDAEARTALDTLIRDFPEQEQLVAQAREQLAAAQPALLLGPAPWQDGEVLKYQIRLPTGKVLGSLYLKAESAVVDGTEAWQLELHRFVITNADNYGVSRILVDRHTQQPIRSTIRHGIMGTADATFGPDGVEIGGTNGNHVDFPQQVYDNDQFMHLLRMLPFEQGYETKINVLPIWTTEVIEVALDVKGTKNCRVPAGDFECYRVDLELGQPGSRADRQRQEMWYSTGPERYPIQLKAEGIIFELIEIGRTEPGTPVAFGLEDFGFAGLLPAGWLMHEQRPPGRKNKAAIRFLDPDAAAISSLEADRCSRGRCPALEQTAENELSGARERFEEFELREESWTERTIDGRPAISFVGDYMRGGDPWVQYRLYTFIHDDVRLELIFRTPAENFEKLRAAFDSLVDSLEASS